jgi:epoxyqueuosine reductase
MSAPVVARALDARIRDRARELGFDTAGIVRLGPVPTYDAFRDWIGRGYAGDMTYLPRGAEKRQDTRRPVSHARSAIVVTLDYGGREPAGPVARYARGDDYHDVMLERLDALHRWIEAECGHAVGGKAYVDTGPILERDLAQRAGLGWIGKNTMLLDPERGSFFFLGALLLDLELEPDAPFEADRCGTCTRCIDACPTGAIVEPRVVDATRCISYLTIEHRGAIGPPLRPLLGDHLYGCDVCQDVCPWNERFASALDEPAFAPRAAVAGRDARALSRELLGMPADDFSRAFERSPMKRAKLRGLKRNAAVVLGNVGSADDIPALTAALHDDEPLVREHAAWALERIAERLAAARSRE